MKIYHKKRPTFFTVAVEPFNAREFDLVADLSTTDLDAAFELTQNIDEAWRQPIPCRSSSVGDVFVTDDGTAYAVCSVGFEQVATVEAEDASLVRLGEALGYIDTNADVTR